MGLSQLAVTVRAVRPECTLAEAAHVMMTDSVGALLITDAPHGPIKGILTDRDIVSRIADGVDPGVESVASFTARPVATIAEGASRAEVLEKMRSHGVRRIPLLNDEGDTLGIVTLDDLLVDLGSELSDVAGTVRSEFRREIGRREA